MIFAIILLIAATCLTGSAAAEKAVVKTGHENGYEIIVEKKSSPDEIALNISDCNANCVHVTIKGKDLNVSVDPCECNNSSVKTFSYSQLNNSSVHNVSSRAQSGKSSFTSGIALAYPGKSVNNTHSVINETYLNKTVWRNNSSSFKENNTSLQVHRDNVSRVNNTSEKRNISVTVGGKTGKSIVTNVTVVTNVIVKENKKEGATVSHVRNKKIHNRLNIIEPSDKPEFEINISSPSDSVSDNDVTFLASTNLTTEMEKRWLHFGWSVTQADSGWSRRIGGNNETMFLPDGAYRADLTVKDYLGRTETISKNFTVSHQAFGSERNISSISNVNSTELIESNAGTMWQAGTGLALNVSNVFAGTLSWFGSKDINTTHWQDYKKGNKDLRKELILSFPGEKKIALVATYIHGGGSGEFGMNVIYSG